MTRGKRYDVHLHAGDESVQSGVAREAPLPDGPRQIALLGDFSGRENRGATDRGGNLGARTPVRVDRDNLDDVLARCAPELRLSLEAEDGPTVSLCFSSLDDFHPDALYHGLDVLQPLRQLRDQLADPRNVASQRPPEAPEDPDKGSPAHLDGVQDLLGKVIDQTALPLAGSGAAGSDDLQAFVRRVVAPHLVPESSDQQREQVARVDAAIEGLLREVLHHPDFQALESLWRSVDFLVRRVETDAQLRLFLIDVTQSEVAADLASGTPVQDSSLCRLLVESTVGTPGAEPWAVIASGYVFGPDAADLELLGRLATLARMAGAPWLAAADPRIAGCPSVETCPDPRDWVTEPIPHWSAVRRSPEAEWLGLALPRILLRVPYSPDTEPCQALAFWEMPESPVHEAYLWGNPAFACAGLIARSFAPSGSGPQQPAGLEIGALPLHIYHQGGEARVQPCAEALLTERAAVQLLDAGLMPFVSLKDRDVVRLLRIQSVAEPAAPLAGPWNPRRGA
jgi:type VI secretion system protein ImpC